jgi:hypothetical protein
VDCFPIFNTLAPSEEFIQRIMATEFALFKVVLDITEYAMIRFDAPKYENYEKAFIPLA